MNQVVIHPNLVPVEFDDDEVRVFALHDRRLLLLKNRSQSKQNGKEEYFHLGTDYTRSGQQGKVNIDDEPTLVGVVSLDRTLVQSHDAIRDRAAGSFRETLETGRVTFQSI